MRDYRDDLLRDTRSHSFEIQSQPTKREPFIPRAVFLSIIVEMPRPKTIQRPEQVGELPFITFLKAPPTLDPTYL